MLEGVDFDIASRDQRRDSAAAVRTECPVSWPRQRRGVTYSCVHLEFYPIIIFYEIVREIEPLLGIVQMFTHVGNLIKLYSAASPAFYIILLVSYYQTVPCFPFKATCPLLECLSPSQIIIFLCFQCMSCHNTSSIISNPTKIGCILQRYSCGPNQRFICRSQLIVFSWRMSECVDCHFNVSPTAAGRRNNVTTAGHQWSTSGAIVPVSPTALSPPLAHNGTHFRNIHKILAAEKLKRMPFSLRQWLALILMSPDLHPNNSTSLPYFGVKLSCILPCVCLQKKIAYNYPKVT